MQKLSRFIAAFAFLAVLAVPSFAAPAMTVKSGELTATINGVTKTFKAGDEVPAGAVLSATSKAEVTVGAQTVTIPQGTAVQLASTDSKAGNSILGVRVVSGDNSVTLTTKDSVGRHQATTTISKGSEVNVDSKQGELTVVAGSATFNGKHVAEGETAYASITRIHGALVIAAVYNTTSSIPPPPPTQEKTVVSGSTPS